MVSGIEDELNAGSGGGSTPDGGDPDGEGLPAHPTSSAATMSEGTCDIIIA